MRCRTYRELISKYIDDALSQHERSTLFEHLGHCPACAALLARYRSIEAILYRLPECQPSPSVRQNVLQGIQGRRWIDYLGHRVVSGLDFRSRSPILSAGALAVLVLIGLGALAASRAGWSAEGQAASVGTGSALSSALGEASVTLAGEPATMNHELETGQGRSAGDSPLLEISNMNQSVGVTLQQVLMQSGVDHPIRIPLPRYLPAGMHLERFDLNAGQPPDELDELEIAYRAKDGKLVLIHDAAGPLTLQVPKTASLMVVRGREWWIDQRSEPASTVLPSYMVFTRQNDGVVVLNAVLPLDELIKMIESFEWAEE